MKKQFFKYLLVLFLLGSSVSVSAQCSMCRRVAETNHDSKSNKVGKSLNSAILYLMALPYILGAAGVVYWWKTKNKE